MPILSEDAMKAWTSLGNRNRQKAKKLSTSSALLLSSDAARPPLKVKIKIPPLVLGKPQSRQVRRAEERKKSK